MNANYVIPDARSAIRNPGPQAVPFALDSGLGLRPPRNDEEIMSAVKE